MSNYIDLIDQQVVTENPVQLKAFQHGRIYAENGHSRIPDFLTEGFPSSLRLDIFAIVFLGNAVLWLVFGLAHDTSQASVNNRG